jgi:hypothetical protein
MRTLFATLVFAGVLSSTLSVAAQTRRAVAKKPVNKAAVNKAAAEDEKVDLTGLLPPDRSKLLGAAFRDGALPPAAAVPAGAVEEQAVALAAALNAGDEGSTPALLAALRAAGYGVRGREGVVNFNQGGWQGIALDEWEVAAAAKLYGDGWGVGLGRLGDSLAHVAPEWKRETNAADLVHGVRAAATSDNASLRFWGNFIIELGRHAADPYDLRKDEDAQRARLDAVQVLLILTRLAADLNFAGRRAQRRAELEREEVERERGAVRFVNASYDGGAARRRSAKSAPAASAVNEPAQQGAAQPCTMGEMESLILDLNATGMGIGFGQLLGYLEAKKVVSENPGQIMGAANAALIVLKLILSYAALESEITLEGGMLTRTKKAAPGERRALSAKVKMDVGKWQVMNCVRPALNLAGLDFSLPGNGALGGVRVDWNLGEGGDTRGYLGRVWDTATNAGKILNGEQTGESDAIVFLDIASDAADAAEKRHYNYTDADGVSKVYAVGVGQKRDMSNEVLRPVMKRMGVDINIQVKTMRLTNGTAAAGTANDLAGNAIAFLTDDKLGFVAGTAAETAYRSNLGSSKTHYFPVKDWAPCDGRWRGTVTYHRTFDESRSNPVKGIILDGGIKASRSHREYLAKIYVEQVPSATNPLGELKTFARIASVEEDFNYSRVFYHDSCGNRGNSARTKTTETVSLRVHSGAAAVVPDQFQLFINGTQADIYFLLPDIPGKFFERTTQQTSGFCNNKQEPPYQKSNDAKIDGIRYGERVPFDPNNPTILKGSKTINNNGSKLVLTWDFSRCR